MPYPFGGFGSLSGAAGTMSSCDPDLPPSITTKYLEGGLQSRMPLNRSALGASGSGGLGKAAEGGSTPVRTSRLMIFFATLATLSADSLCRFVVGMLRT